MRILYSHRVQSRDGQAVHIEQLIGAMRHAGHEVRVVAPESYGRTEFGGSNRLTDAVRRLLPASAGEWAELAYNEAATRRLLAAARAFKPDLIYERCNLFFSAGLRVARRIGAPLYLEVNSPLADERAAHGGLALKRRATALELRVWRGADRVLPVTRVLADILVGAGVRPERVTVIPNGVDLAHFPPRDADAGDGSVALGFVGFVRPWHGLDRVIDAMAAAPERARLTLTVVGDGPVRAELQAQAERLGLGAQVRFTGVVPPDQVPAHVRRFDIALQPQATPYASPLKMFDYMAAGCAVVAPDQPNIREIARDGETALLFDPADPTGPGRAIARLVEDAALRLRLGAAARQWIEATNRTWAGNAATILALAEADIAARTSKR